MNYINYNYVDDVNTDSIVNAVIVDVLGQLDPHSIYIPERNYPEVAQRMNGSFVGIGIQFFRIKDTIAVIRTLKNGPSRKAGILPGDRIVYADDQALFGADITNDTIKRLLRGKANSTVQLTVERQGEQQPLTIAVQRSRIPLRSVDAAYMLNDHLGYVKIERFSRQTYEEFKKALKKLAQKDATGLVLDLRNNGGGYLKEAIQVADEFLAEGKLIVFTKDRHDAVEKTYATAAGDFEHTEVFVLINEQTASASEVIAGALQDNDVGTIVGRRSYGKGLVQRKMSFDDGSAVRLTVARYYTPTGRSIQKPFERGHFKEYYDDYIERYHNGELKYADSIPIVDSLKFVTPGGDTVYGGGGIVPDVFVAEDISFKKESLDYMLHGGMLDRFVFELMDKNRPYYNQLTREEFAAEVVINDQMIAEFEAFLAGYRLHFSARDYVGILKKYIKATMAKQLFGTTVYAQIIGRENPAIETVLRLDEAYQKP